ncbi:EamA family transporter [Streptomyces narbonensis]
MTSPAVDPAPETQQATTSGATTPGKAGTRTAAPAARRITGAVWAALGIVYVVWGSTYLGIRIVVETMPPFLSAGVRFVTAGLLLAGIIAWRQGPAAFKVTRRQLGSAVLIGLLLILGGNGLVVLAETSIPSGLTALLISVVPSLGRAPQGRHRSEADGRRTRRSRPRPRRARRAHAARAQR